MTFNLELEGSRVLITAGTKGIGEAVVKLFRELGADVITIARTRTDATPEELFVAADLTTEHGCSTVVNAIGDRYGCLRWNPYWPSVKAC